MSEQVDFVQDGINRFNDAYRSVDEGVKHLQQRLEAGRKTVEREIDTRRKLFEEQTRGQIEQIQGHAVVQRVLSIKSDTTRQIETSIQSLLDLFDIASKSDIQRVDKKLKQLNRKLRDLEQAKTTNGATAA
ncbi:hypothetical protein MK489_00630 [Myxococcota bacterium]|nr:hypothetical protein [Myxococcota bacterium]